MLLKNEGKTIISEVGLSRFDFRLKRFRRVPEAAVEHMVTSLKKNGQLTPVIAVLEGNGYILVDGFKRYMAAETLGYKTLLVLQVDWDSAHQKAQMYLLNKSNGFTFIEECVLLLELVDKDGFNQAEAAAILQRHKSWVCRRLQIVRHLSGQVIEDIRLGNLPGGSAASLARLTPDIQAEFDAVIQSHHLQPNECKQLIDLWCKAETPEIRQFLVNSPRQVLETFKSGNVATQWDGPIPVAASRWFFTLRSLDREATALGLHSKKNIGPLDDKLHRKFLKTLDDAEKDCREALGKARDALSAAGAAWELLQTSANSHSMPMSIIKNKEINNEQVERKDTEENP